MHTSKTIDMTRVTGIIEQINPLPTGNEIMRPLALAIMALSCLSATDAQAKDLSGRLGVGFNNQFAGLSSLSARWNLPSSTDTSIAIEANLGFSMMAGSDDAFFAGGRGLYGIVKEDNMTLSVGAGVGFLSEATQTAFRFQPVMSAEFFIYGLENLGFLLEWGVNFDLSSETEIHTMSGSPSLGLHYYF